MKLSDALDKAQDANVSDPPFASGSPFLGDHEDETVGLNTGQTRPLKVF